jgi:hypothetical protein
MVFGELEVECSPSKQANKPEIQIIIALMPETKTAEL